MPGVSPHQRARLASLPFMRLREAGTELLDAGAGPSFAGVSAGCHRECCSRDRGAERVGGRNQRTMGAAGDWTLDHGLHRRIDRGLDQANLGRRPAGGEELAD